MLHPDLGTSRDPLGTWQVDTHEIGVVAGLYSRHLSGAKEPEQLARCLGLLRKKLGGAPRLARLVCEYAELQWHAMAAAASGARRRGEPRFVERVLAAMGRPSPRRESTPRPGYAVDDPLYDRWIDE